MHYTVTTKYTSYYSKAKDIELKPSLSQDQTGNTDGWKDYENINDLNINVLMSAKDMPDHLKDFTDLFSLTNFKSTATYTKNFLVLP